jgi:D-alanyl-D-alanine carboxypeptidase
VRAFAVAVLALMVWALPATAATPKRANLPQLARSLVKAGAPGAIVYVRTPTATRAGAAGFADVSAHATMRASFRYRIASVSKAFVSVVILQLEAEGKLDIDDPVEKYLPGVVPNGGAIAVRRLMNHTSGLFNYTDDEKWLTDAIANPLRVWTPLELLSYAFARPPNFLPGRNWAYSNTGYIVLGLVAEKVAGKPLGTLLQERIFGPLELTSTTFPTGIQFDATFVHGYGNFAASGPTIDLTPLVDPSWAWAAGGIVSSAPDVTLFYRALLTGKLLAPAQLKEMKTMEPIAGTYGLGISMTEAACSRVWGHAGDFPGWRNLAMATANGKREVVVMVNVDERFVNWERVESVAKTALCRG